MKKIILILGLMFILSGCVLEKNSLKTKDTEEDLRSPEQIKCESAGAEYKGFSNGCMDDCKYKRNPKEAICEMNAPSGCYCGDDQCWNGSGCEDL